MTASITVLVAEALGALIADRVAALTGKVAVVQAPPTADRGYPAAAVMPEPTFRFDVEHDVEVRDADGAVMTGDGRALVTVGALRTSLRIWLAARTPAQRESLEVAVTRLFFGDELAPTRLELALSGFEVDGFTPPVTWPVYCFVEDGEWQDELVFSERRWAFLRCSVDVPILILRDDVWRVSQMRAALAAGTQVTPPAVAFEESLVGADGSTSPAP